MGKHGILHGTKINPSSGSSSNVSMGDAPDPSISTVSSSSPLSNPLPRDSTEDTAVRNNQVEERVAAVDETLAGIGALNSYRSNDPSTATTLPPASSTDGTVASAVSVDRLDATSPSGLDAQAPSIDQPSSSARVSLVDSFLESFTAALNGTDRSGFEEVFVPILKRRLPTANESLQKSIISYFEKGGSFSQPILEHCDLSDWVKESLIQDLICGFYEDGKEITFPHFLKQLEQIVAHYKGSSLEKLLWAIRDAVDKQKFSLMDLSDLLEFLLHQTNYDDASSLLSNRSSWSTWLPCKYLDHQLKKQQVNISNEDYLVLSKSVSNEKWRPCLITELVTIIKQTSDFRPTKDLLNFIQKHDFSGKKIGQALYAYPDDQGINRLNRWLSKLAHTVVEDQICNLFPYHASAINAKLPEFFTYASPIDTLDSFIGLLDSLPELSTKKLNTRRSKLFSHVVDLLSEYKVDCATSIEAFKLLKKNIKPKLWNQAMHEVHKLVISFTFKGVKVYSLSELTQKISQQSPNVSFVSDPNLLYQRCQEVISSYHGCSSILPGKPISEWTKDDVEIWSKLVKGNSNSALQEVLAVIRRAVVLHHHYELREPQLLTLLILLNPAEGLGRLAQVNTGEGKSVIIAMLAAVHALQGKKVDIITTSTELTIPEVTKQAGFFKMLKLTVGENSRKDFNAEKETIKAVYAKDIVYGTPMDFQGDILRTVFSAMDTREGREFDVPIVDEADNMLYDQRKHFTRLSSLMPGMDHLALTLGAIWHEVSRLKNQTIEIDGRDFLITEPCTKGGSPSEPTISLSSDKPLASCLKPIESVETFIKQQVKARMEHALRVLTPEEAQEWKAYKALQQKDAQIDIKQKRMARKIAKRELKLSKGLRKWMFGNVEKHRERLAAYKKEALALSQASEASAEALKNALFTKKEGILDIPDHLRKFVSDQLPYWIDNAIKALYVLKKGFHYTVVDGRIVPIDYDNTGVLLHNVVWSDGMHQFLQIKEGLKITPENVATNFLTNASFFKRYRSPLFGLTGTIGNISTQRFLQNMYNVDMVFIPPYQFQQIACNETSHYRCKELPAIIVSTTEAWYKAICDSTVNKVRNGRPVLIICKYIEQVTHLQDALAERLGNHYRNRIFPYTGESKTTHSTPKDTSERASIDPNLNQLISSFGNQEKAFTKRDIDLGEIIIATNIAGRGTDITTSDEVEAVGGMHVCITFLPESYRVEIQNAGRTARQGRKGTAQLVIHDTSNRSIGALRSARNEQEAIETTNAQKDVAEACLQDRIFSCFCGLESELLPRASDAEKMNQYAAIKSNWLIHKEKTLNAYAIDRDFKRVLPKLLESAVDDYKRNSSEEEKSDAKFPEYVATFKEEMKQLIIDKKGEIEKSYRENVLRDFCYKLQDDKYPIDVIECFREGKPFVPKGSSLAMQYGWGEYERSALQEQWGIWFNRLQHENKFIDLQDAVKEFNKFGNDIRSDGNNDKLVKNPYYYVQKGNEALDCLKNPQLAIEIYKKAIDLDETYNVTARYNKARALLTIEDDKEGNQKIAKSELEETIRLINYEYKPALISFQNLLVLLHQNAEKIAISDHVAHQFDILCVQSDYIDIAIEVLDKALRKGWHVKLTNQSLQEALKGTDGDHSQAIGEAYANGLTDIFTLSLKKPTPWYSIVAVAILGALQATAGFLMTVYTPGSPLALKLIKDGFGDLFTSVTSAIKGDFSWKSWSIEKGISWSTSFISSGWKGIKQMGTDIKNTFRGMKNSLTGINQAVIPTCATVGDGGIVIDKVIKSSQPALLRKNIEAAKHQLVQRFKESVTNNLLQVSLEHMVADPILHGIRSLIDKKLDELLSLRLQNNTLIARGIALDLKNRDNHCQQLFINDGLKILEPSPNSTLIGVFTEIGKGVLINKIDELNAAKDENKLTGEDYVDTMGVLKLIGDLTTEAPKFLDKFESNIQAHARHIDEAERRAAEEEQASKDYQLDQVMHSSSANTLAPPSEITFDAVRADQFRSDHNYNLNPLSPDYGAVKRQAVGMAKFRTCYFPSSIQQIKNVFKSAITHMLVDSVSSNLFQPVTKRFSTWGAQEIWKEIGKEIKYFNSTDPQTEIYNLTEGIIREPDELPVPKDLSKCSPIVQEFIKSLEGNAPVGMSVLAHIAKELMAPIQAHINGIYYVKVGGNLPGRTIIINLIKTDKGSHWVNMRDPALPTSDSSGENNCLFKAILPQSYKKDLLSPADLRNKCIESCLRNPKRTLEIIKNRSIIQSRDPGALYEGGCDAMDFYSMKTDPHGAINTMMLFGRNKEYRELTLQAQKVDDPRRIKEINRELRKIELENFNETKKELENFNNDALYFLPSLAAGLLTFQSRMVAYGAITATGTVLDSRFWTCVRRSDIPSALGVIWANAPVFRHASMANNAYKEGDYKGVAGHACFATLEAVLFFRPPWTKLGARTKVRDSAPVTNDLARKINKLNSKFKKTVTADGKIVYQRNDLFDPNQVSQWTVNGRRVTGTNIERMASGRAPLCKDGNPIHLHHIGQSNESNLLELTHKQHTKYYKQLHDPKITSSDINRPQFKTWKRNYWKNRATEKK